MHSHETCIVVYCYDKAQEFLRAESMQAHISQMFICQMCEF